MIGILTALICTQGVCQKVYIPTPFSFTCAQNFDTQAYLDVAYPQWKVLKYHCVPGRAA